MPTVEIAALCGNDSTSGPGYTRLSQRAIGDAEFGRAS
jgi:hypothetical protein